MRAISPQYWANIQYCVDIAWISFVTSSEQYLHNIGQISQYMISEQQTAPPGLVVKIRNKQIRTQTGPWSDTFSYERSHSSVCAFSSSFSIIWATPQYVHNVFYYMTSQCVRNHHFMFLHSRLGKRPWKKIWKNIFLCYSFCQNTQNMLCWQKPECHQNSELKLYGFIWRVS